MVDGKMGCGQYGWKSPLASVKNRENARRLVQIESFVSLRGMGSPARGTADLPFLQVKAIKIRQ